jgi:hypothetical protein
MDISLPVAPRSFTGEQVTERGGCTTGKCRIQLNRIERGRLQPGKPPPQGVYFMVLVKRLVLDILKPHLPNSLEFSCSLAQVGEDYHVSLTVIEVDENTESIQLEIEGHNLDFPAICAAISDMSGSLHSIDVVEVQSQPDTTPGTD